MREEAQRHGSPAPVFTAGGFFTATFQPLDTRLSAMTGEATGQVTGQAAGEVFRLIQVLAQGPLTRVEAQTLLALTSQANFRDRYLQPALGAGFIEMTILDKPNSSNNDTPSGSEP